MQKMMVPTALLIWVTIVVAAMSYSPEGEDELFGTIEGIIVPNDVRSYVYAYYDEDIMAMVESDTETGTFVISELPEGTYSIVVSPVTNDYAQTEITDLIIEIDEVQNLAEIVLVPAVNDSLR